MAPNLIAAKLEPPLLPPSLVSRSPLIQKLNRGLHQGHKVLLLSAPDGFGKTTVLAAWLAQSGWAYTWLSLGEDENDPIEFLIYLIAALQKIHPEIGTGLQGAWLMKDPNPDRLMMTLVSDMARKQKDFILVLDDYHQIQSPIIHRLVGILLEHSPATMRIAIADAGEPPLPLSVWRATHQLSELRAIDLCFSQDEIREFAHHLIGAPLSPVDVQAIQNCSGGWPAGVLFACHLLRRSREQALTRNGSTGSLLPPAKLAVSTARPGEVDEEVASFLLQAIFDDHPEAVRKALMQASIVRWIGTPVIAAFPALGHVFNDSGLTPEASSFPPLYDCLFAQSSAGWVRLHPYWQDFLALQLRASFPQEAVAEFHTALSHRFEAHGYIDEAILHALTGPEHERAASLIENEIEHAFWSQGSAVYLRLCLNRMPKPFLAAHPRLALQFAQAMFVLEDFQAAECCLQLARERSEAPEKENNLRAELAALHACLLRVRGELDLFVELATHMLARRSDLTPRSTILLLHHLGLAMIQLGDLSAAREKIGTAYGLALNTGNVILELVMLFRLAQIEKMSGRLKEVESLCLQGLKLCTMVGEAVNLFAGLLSACLGEVYYEWNRLEEAARFYKTGLKTGARAGYRALFISSCSGMVRLLIARGETNRTEIWMRALREPVQASTQGDDRSLAGLLAGLELRRGNLEAAARWADHFRLYPDSSCTCDEMVENEAWVRVQVALSQEQQDAARLRQTLEALPNMLHRTEAVGWMPVTVRLYILQALAYNLLEARASAVYSLSCALKLAAPAKLVRTFVDEGQTVYDLLQEVSPVEIPREYIQELSRAFSKRHGTAGSYNEPRTPGSDSGELEKTPALATASDDLEKDSLLSLTSREQDVLALLASGLSYEETAGELVITVNTVRTHIKSIYRKLGVSSRISAVQEASRLGILTC